MYNLQRRQSRHVCNLGQSKVSNKRKNNEQFRINKRIRNSNINQVVEKNSTNNGNILPGNGVSQYYETVTINERLIAERNYNKLQKQEQVLLKRSNYVLEKKSRMRFINLNLSWNIECQFCYCLHLNCSVKEERRQCCNFGEMIHNVDKSKYCLKPLSDKWWKLLIDNSTHFITNDILYNNKFRLSFSGN